MPVVPSFTNGKERDIRIFSGVRKHIIRMIPIQVSRRINEPSEMKNEHVSQGPCDKKSIPELFPPNPRGNLGGEDKTHVEGKPRVQLLLEHDNGIFIQIGEI